MVSLKKVSHKFFARPCELDGIKFPSKLEAAYYSQLKLRQRAGDIVFFLRQTPFHLPAGIKYLTDFTVFWADGSVEFIDTKGKDTPISIAKRKMVQEIYNIDIKIVRSV